MPRARPHTPARSAFTLVEVIVVIVIIGVLAALVAPAVLRTSERQAENESGAVQRLLTVAAERDALWGQTLAIDYDDAASQLTLVTRTTETTSVAAASGPPRFSFEPDRLVEPVVLTHTRLARATSDGRALSRSRWRVMFTPAEPRPALVLNLERRADAAAAGPKVSWTISLTPDAPAAVRASGGSTLFASDRSIDLDAAGRGDKPW